MSEHDAGAILVEALRSQVVQVDPDASETAGPDGTHWWRLDAEFAYGDLAITADVFVSAQPNGEARVELSLPINDAEFDLLDERADEAAITFDIEIDEEAEIVLLVVTRELDPRTSLTTLIERLQGDVVTLVEAATVELVHVADYDPTLGSDADALARLRHADPQAAVDLLSDMVERCRRHGAFALGAGLAIGQAEMLAELGRAREAAGIAQRAWELLGEPVDRADLTISYAAVLGRTDRNEQALSLVRASLAEASDTTDRSALLGAIGTLLANTGERAEAIDFLAVAVADPMLDDETSAVLRENLDLLRKGFHNPHRAQASPDAAADLDRAIMEVGSEWDRTNALDRRLALPAVLSRLDEMHKRWDRFSEAQKAQFLIVRAQIEATFDTERARAALDLARGIATAQGDSTTVSLVDTAAALLGLTQSDDEPRATQPWEALAVSVNRVAREMTLSTAGASAAEMQRWGAELKTALSTAADQIPTFRDVRDRERWRATMARGYDLALLIAHTSNNPRDAIATLGRMHDQGRPVASGAGQAAEATVLAEAEMRRLLRQATVLAVGPAHEAPPVARLARAAAGGPAWWWTSAIVENRLHWGLSAPDGSAWSGWRFLPAAPLWPTIDLAGLADLVLPEPLRAALSAAASTGATLRVACALASELTGAPIVALPIGGGRLVIDGAITAIAPPRWLYGTEITRSPLRTRSAVAFALGGDPGLGSLAALVGPFRSRPETQVLGGTLQVMARTADELATPVSTPAAWSHSRSDIAVYYGHIVAGGADEPLSGGLVLTANPGGSARWTVHSMIRAREGLAHTVVLAGCSSLGLPTAGGTEWWGPACGVLANGSTFVVGTRWELRHSDENVAFVVDLVEELQRRPGDAPAALWHTQRRWRDLASDEEAPALPVWSAYAVVGADVEAAS